MFALCKIFTLGLSGSLLSDVTTPLTGYQFEPNIMRQLPGQTQHCFVSWGFMFLETDFLKQHNIVTIIHCSWNVFAPI